MEQQTDVETQGHSRWADLPPELLRKIMMAAHQQLCSPACGPALPSVGFPLHGQLPSLRQVAELCLAAQASCRSWRAATSAPGLPLHVALGRTPLPAAGGAPPAALAAHAAAGAGTLQPQLRAWLGRHSLAALHFEAPQQPAAVQLLAIELLGCTEMERFSAASLVELAIWDYCCSRPLCALLPRFPALRLLALTGYSIDLDLEPLRQLPCLTALHVEAEALPKLSALPATLRHLSLSCFANAARVSLPLELHLESLVCHCPDQPVFLGLSRALRQCRRIRVAGRRLHLLLKVPADQLPLAAAQAPPAAGSAAAAAVAAEALVGEFQGQAAAVVELQLEAPAKQLGVKLAPQVGHSAAAAAPPAWPLVWLDAQVVAACAASRDAVSARLLVGAEAGGCGATGLPFQGQRLVLRKKPPPGGPAACPAP